MTPLRQSLLRSLAAEGVRPVRPITAQVRQLDERYWTLHRRCATGSITDAEMDELDTLIAAKELEYELSQRNA